jgi:hypothetical protein
LFGFEVRDYHRPRINRIKIYSADFNSRVNGVNEHAVYTVEGWGEKHRLGDQRPITVSGNIGFGVQCDDQHNDSPNRNGIYSFKVFFDGKKVSETRMESFPFSDTRYINSLIDYPEYAASGMRFQRTEIDPGNRLKIYSDNQSNGLVFIDDTLIHKVRMELADISGNLSVLEFNVMGERAGEMMDLSVLPEFASTFYYDRTNRFETAGFFLESPPEAFYRNFFFTYDVSPPCEECLSPVHHVHNMYNPIHNPVQIALKPDGIPGDLLDKALIIKINDKEDGFFSAGGSYDVDDGFVHTRIREFGKYSVALDTVPPSITALNASSQKALKTGDILKFRISDELSGISEYRGTVNEEWILMEYDAKNDLLFYYVNGHLKKGANNFRLKVKDSKDNTRIYEAILFLE